MDGTVESVKMSDVLMPKEKMGRHFAFIDWVYFIGIVLVVFGHSHPLGEGWEVWYSRLNGWIYSFHMPLFYFVSGFLLVHSKSIDKLGYPKWVLSKLLKFGVPYLVLTAVAYVPKYLLGDTTDAVTLGLGYFLETTFLRPRVGVWGHFWFIYVLMILEAVWGAWRALWRKDERASWWFLGIGFAVSFGMSVNWIRTTLFALQDLSFVAIFYVCGILTALVKPVLWDKRWKNVAAILVCAAVCRLTFDCGNFWISTNTIFNFFNALLLVWIFWNLGVLLAPVKCRLVPMIVPWGFTIFVYSWPVQAVFETILRRCGVSWNVTVAILFVVGFVFPLLLVYCYRRFTWCQCKFLDDLFGINTRVNR